MHRRCRGCALFRTGRQLWLGWTSRLRVGGFFDGILLHQILQWHHRAVMSAWFPGIHRIRMDTASPMFWHLLAHRPRENSPFRLLAHGALALDSGFLPAGCFTRLRSDRPGA
jgi:hypothetical protein